MGINVKKNLMLLPVAALLLSGCATNEFSKYPKPTIGSTVLVVPVGSLEAQHASSKAGSFGLIGALTELALTADSNKSNSKTLTSEMVEAKIEDYLGQQLLAKISACGVAGTVHKEIVVNNDTEWFKNTKSAVPEFAKTKADYVIETGALSLSIRDGLVVKELCARGAAKVFRTSDGLLVNKANSWTCYKATLEHYSDGDAEKYVELKNATKELMNDIAATMSYDICTKAQ